MTFLVTGATGFIGARVVARLLERRIPIIAADLRPDPAVAEQIERQRAAGDAAHFG
jgi:uncharacterized protein YbjT (DUF2867 family)